MSKQDRQGVRTATDLERKYGFGQSFAEIYGLIDDTRTVAEEAVEQLDEELDFEEIFNRLTNYGEIQTIYRENDNIYINASYIKSGTLAANLVDADNLKVKAANVTGKLEADQIDATNLEVNAANITGKLTAGQIDATNLVVSAANISGRLNAYQIDSTYLTVQAANISGTLMASQIDSTGLRVDAANIDGYLSVLGGGTINIYGTDNIKYGHLFAGVNSLGSVALEVHGDSGLRLLSDYGNVFIQSSGGAKVALEGSQVQIGPNAVLSDGTIITSDRDKKNTIEYNPWLYDAFFDSLRPARFKYNHGTSDRFHIGLLADEVKEALETNGLTTQDFAAYCEVPVYSETTGEEIDQFCALRYSEFVALNIYQIQQLKDRVAELEAKIG